LLLVRKGRTTHARQRPSRRFRMDDMVDPLLRRLHAPLVLLGRLVEWPLVKGEEVEFGSSVGGGETGGGVLFELAARELE
jgi:hypothetical protein